MSKDYEAFLKKDAPFYNTGDQRIVEWLGEGLKKYLGGNKRFNADSGWFSDLKQIVLRNYEELGLDIETEVEFETDEGPDVLRAATHEDNKKVIEFVDESFEQAVLKGFEDT